MAGSVFVKWWVCQRWGVKGLGRDAELIPIYARIHRPIHGSTCHPAPPPATNYFSVTTTNASFDPIVAKFVANIGQIAALNLQSTLPRQYARKHRYSERTGTVSQTKSDSRESTQIGEVDEKFHEDCLCAQASNKPRSRFSQL